MSKTVSQSLMQVTSAVKDLLLSFAHDHPVHVAIRTYVLGLSLSLTPALVPFFTSRTGRRRLGGLEGLKNTLKRELGVTGFAFAITTAVGGGAALQRLWSAFFEEGIDLESAEKSDIDISTLRRKLRTWLSSPHISALHKAFICNALSSLVAILLLQSRRRSSPQAVILLNPPLSASSSRVRSRNKPSATLDLTLLVFVRAADAALQACLVRYLCRPDSSNGKNTGERENIGAKEKRQNWTMKLDALWFWMCSARIMWCFFYEPERITSLADIDDRLLLALRAIRSGNWSYTGFSTEPHLLTSMAHDMGMPPSWGDPAIIPSRGGPKADEVWRSIGVKGRNGIGGLPCEIVHGGVDRSSCSGNAARRGGKAFLEALAIYLPVHFLPLLFTRPRSLLNLHRVLLRLLSAFRSATFLSAFLSSVWFTVCLTRTLFVARLFPSISHDFYDGPFGCIFAGCLACGGSIWIEDGRRRGEMALYVLPRAIRSWLPDEWVRSGNKKAVLVERITFVLSLSTLLTAAIHRPNSLRGLSQWALDFVMKGPNVGIFRRRQQEDSSSTPKPLYPTDHIT